MLSEQVVEKGARMRKSDLIAFSHFRKDRDVSLPFTLQLSPADSPYVVFPMTHEKGMAGEFFLNVWHKKEIFIRGGEVVLVDEAAGSELDEDPWEVRAAALRLFADPQAS